MEIIDFFLLRSPLVLFALAMLVSATLPLCDKEVRRCIPIAVFLFFIGPTFVLCLFAVGEIPLNRALACGFYLYFAALVGSGLRPGLLLQLPSPNKEGKWLCYKNFYFFAGYAAIYYFWVVAIAPRL